MGKYIPEKQISSTELEKEWNLPEGWIKQRNGVEYRHYANKTETGAYMGARALEQALERAGMRFEELDLLLDASGSFDYPIPHNACLIPAEMGYLNAGIPCWDIDSTCLSFVTALDVASYLLDGKRFKKIAIVSSEISSNCLDPKEPKTASLFGDSAAAAIVCLPEAGESSAILAAEMQTFSEGALFTVMPGGGNVFPPLQSNDHSDYSFKMDGPKVLKMAMDKLGPFMAKLFEQVDFGLDALDLLVPHQASKVGLDFAQKALNLPVDKMVNVLHKYGNCISASIPVALCEAIEDNRLQRGQKCMLVGTAAGLSIGAVIFTY